MKMFGSMIVGAGIGITTYKLHRGYNHNKENIEDTIYHHRKQDEEIIQRWERTQKLLNTKEKLDEFVRSRLEELKQTENKRSYSREEIDKILQDRLKKYYENLEEYKQAKQRRYLEKESEDRKHHYEKLLDKYTS
jgi:hypothetical protein